MKFSKSYKILITAILIIFLGLFLTKVLLRSKNKFLFYRVCTINKPDLLVDNQLLNLGGIWLSNYNDSMEFAQPGITDENWRTARFLYLALARNPYGKTWLRKHFKIPGHIPADTLILRLSLLDIQAEVFINGTKIADSCFIYNHSVCCKLPVSYLKVGQDNLIAIRSQSMMSNTTSNINKIKDEILYQVEPTINLEGLWEFSTGDSIQWKEKDCICTYFKKITVPKSWDDQGLNDYDGYAWYRKKFICPAEIRNDTMLFLGGKIDDLNEVYINGEKIGSQLDFKSKYKPGNTWDLLNVYAFNGSILTDTNIVAVRVIDKEKRGGIYQGPVGIMAMNDYLNFLLSNKNQ